MGRLAALALAACLPAAALGQTVCAPREAMAAQLTGRFGETLQGVGLDGAGFVIEIWTHPEGRSFTVLRTDAAGSSCILRDGTLWMPVTPDPPGIPG